MPPISRRGMALNAGAAGLAAALPGAPALAAASELRGNRFDLRLDRAAIITNNLPELTSLR